MRSVDENGDESGLRVEILLIVHQSRRRSRRPKRGCFTGTGHLRDHQFGFWNLKIGTYLEIGSWKFPSLGEFHKASRETVS